MKTHEANLEQYRVALLSHDWRYENSNDPDARLRGAREREALVAKQRVYDPNLVVWNMLAPPEFRIPFKKE